MDDTFVQNFNNFMEENKSNYFDYLLNENEIYINLINNMHVSIENLVDDFPDLEDVIDELSDIFSQISEFENKYLYYRGYIDCLNFLKLLDC